MRRKVFVLAAALMLAATQVHAEVRPEFRPFVGAYVPTGDQADALKSAVVIGGQVGVELAEVFHVVGTLAYATPQAKVLTGDGDVHVYQYDVGVEMFRAVPVATHWTFRPFLGAGAGARTHDFYHRRDVDAQTYVAGYGALGAELQHEGIALRLEARDYVTRFKGLFGTEDAEARNDIMVNMGLALHFW